MDRTRLKGHLEVATNVAVLLVALVILSAFAWSYFVRHSTPQIEDGFQKGQVLASVPGINYGSASQTLLIAMSTKCHYCEESLPFYKQLAEAQRVSDSGTQIIAVFPNAEEEVKQYLQQNEFDLESLSSVDFRALNISRTPTAVLIDSDGKVLDFWVGKLPSDVEQQVVRAVRQSKM